MYIHDDVVRICTARPKGSCKSSLYPSARSLAILPWTRRRHEDADQREVFGIHPAPSLSFQHQSSATFDRRADVLIFHPHTYTYFELSSTCPNDTVNGPGDSTALYVAIPKDVLKHSFLFLHAHDGEPRAARTLRPPLTSPTGSQLLHVSTCMRCCPVLHCSP